MLTKTQKSSKNFKPSKHNVVSTGTNFAKNKRLYVWGSQGIVFKYTAAMFFRTGRFTNSLQNSWPPVQGQRGTCYYPPQTKHLYPLSRNFFHCHPFKSGCGRTTRLADEFSLLTTLPAMQCIDICKEKSDVDHYVTYLVCCSCCRCCCIAGYCCCRLLLAALTASSQKESPLLSSPLSSSSSSSSSSSLYACCGGFVGAVPQMFPELAAGPHDADNVPPVFPQTDELKGL